MPPGRMGAPSSQRAVEAAQHAMNQPVNKSQERFYSSGQLVQALKSSLGAVKEQLHVLTILDSTAMSWPGIQQAMDDLAFMIDMTAQTTGRMENDTREMEATLKDSLSEVGTLKETVAMQNSRNAELATQVDQLTNEVKQLNSQLDAANREVQQQKQELWALEKQRADLASEAERYKQDNEFMEGEINTLRATVTEQMQQITTLKEELSARKADVGHLKQLTTDQKNQIEHLKHTLDSTSAQLRDTQQALDRTRADKEHFEKESDRLQQESARLGAELDKTMRELERIKEWNEVVKRVEADKLRDEQDARNKQALEYEAQRAALDKALTSAKADHGHAEERLRAKTAEAESLAKQLHLAGMQVRDAQKQLTAMSVERTNALKARDEAKAQATKLATERQSNTMQSMQAEKERAEKESRAREEMAAERARLTSAVDEARREGAVQKALAEGWSRDLRETQERVKAEMDKVVALQGRVENLMREMESARYENAKAVSTLESQVKTLQQAVDAKENELKRKQAEMVSEKKRLEKTVESLQRECNESASEVDRLRRGEGQRLPPLGRPLTIQDELDSLKKVLNSMPQGGPERLPAVMYSKQHTRNMTR